MKKIIMIIIVLVLLILGRIVTYIEIKDKKNNPNGYSRKLLNLINKEPTYDKLLRVRYSNSGDMNGNIDTIELDIINKKVTTEYRAEMGDPIKVVEYSVEDKTIENIQEDINKYNFPMWKDLKLNYEMVALDAPTETITFIYDSSKLNRSTVDTYTINFDMEIPEDGGKYIQNFKEKIFKLKNKSNKIKEYNRED